MRMSFRSAGWLLFLVARPLSTVLALSSPTTIFTLPGPVQPASWFENLAVRPNGLILATRGDAPEIWQIDPATGQGGLLVSVEGAFNLTGIAQVIPLDETDDETYVFGSSHIPAPLEVEPGSAKVWTLRFPSNPTTTTNTVGSPAVSLLAALPSAGFINGITPWDAGRVLLSDTDAEAIYLMNVAGTTNPTSSPGTYSTPLTGLAGINGIQTTTLTITSKTRCSESRSDEGVEGEGEGRRRRTTTGWRYIYRANHLSQTLSRIPVDSSDAMPLEPGSPPPEEMLAIEQAIDDFAVVVEDNQEGGGRAYIAGMYDNEVVEVVFGTEVPGVKRVIADDVSGTGTGLVTAVAFGRRPEDAGLLYATVGQGGGSASIVVLDPNE